MAGFAYAVRVRVGPADGPETLYDLTGFAAGGPVSTVVSYEPETVRRTLAGRRQVERRYGARPMIRLRFEMESVGEEATLAEIVSALLDDRNGVYLSTDAGISEREVVLDGPYERRPLAGKAIGIETEISLRAREIAPEITSFDPIQQPSEPVTELYIDTGLEQWTSSVDLTRWIEEGGTVLQELVNPHSGLSSARIYVDAAFQPGIYQQKQLRANKAHRVSWWFRATNAACQPVIGVFEMNILQSLQDDRVSWAFGLNSNIEFPEVGAVDTWRFYSFIFQTNPPGIGESGAFRVKFASSAPANYGRSIYYDDLSLAEFIPPPAVNPFSQ